MSITVITNTNEYPWELLLLADPERGKVERYLASSKVFLFREKETVIGVMAIQKQGDHQYEIMNLAVDEDSQGQGVGRQLLNYGIADLRQETNPVRVIIKTGDISGPALGLYQSLGFTVKEVVNNYFIDHYSEPIYEEGQLLKNQLILEKIV